MKPVLYLLFLLFNLFQIHAQHKRIIYCDVDSKPIYFTNFTKKLETGDYLVVKVDIDTALVKKLRYKEYYGTINSLKKSQLNKLFYNRYQIDSTKIWHIHYLRFSNTSSDVKTKTADETKIVFYDKTGDNIAEIIEPTHHKINYYRYYYLKIPNYTDPETDGKKTLIRTYDSSGKKSEIILNKKELFRFLDTLSFRSHKHVYNSKKIKQQIVNEQNNYKGNENVLLIHFIGDKTKKSITENKLNIFYDQNFILKKTFSDGLEMYPNIILFPNGDFYVSSDFKLPKNIIIPKNYNHYKRKWLKKLVK